MNTTTRRPAGAFPAVRTLETFDEASSIPPATVDYGASLGWIRAAEPSA